jgi:excisionase family DNA binding protein
MSNPPTNPHDGPTVDEAAGLFSLDRRRAQRALRAAERGRSPADLRVETPVDLLRAVLRDELREQLGALVAATDEILTMKGAAKVLSVSTKTLLAWIRGHDLPASKVGAEWRFRRSELVQWIGDRKNVL